VIFMGRALPASLICACFIWAAANGTEPDSQLAPQGRVLPGLQPGGAVQLPNQWSLRPAGKHLELGDFPVNLALHPSRLWLAALHAGQSEHEVIVIDLKRQKIANRVTLDQAFYGLCFSPDGKTLFASGGEYEVVHAFDFDNGLLSKHRKYEVVPD